MSGAPRLTSGRADDKRARALEAAHLVGRQHERVGAERGDVAVDPPGHLHRVAEEKTARGVNQRRRLGDRLDDARLVVRPLQRHEHASRAAARGLEPVEIDAVRPAATAPTSAAGNRWPVSTQACSPAETMSRSSGLALRPPPNSGLSAAFAASVPPDVKVTQRALTPASRATSLLASSTMRRAARPSAWTDEGLPVVSIAERGLARIRTQRRGCVVVEIGAVQ